MRRVPEHEQRRHKITVNLTDQEYATLMDRATVSQLAPSVVARMVFSEGLTKGPDRGKGRDEAVQPASPEMPTQRRASERRKARQAEHDALCLPYLREASSLANAAERLEAAGIPTPSGQGRWTKPVVWRINQRHGIAYR